jgi:hypothetical protein
MLNESFVLSMVILLLCGAACVYLYYCNAYLEKKVGFMESILIDLRMTLDTLLTEDPAAKRGGAVPISSILPQRGAGSATLEETAEGVAAAGSNIATDFTAPEPLDTTEMEQVPEEKFYSSVLEQAHQEAGDTGATGTVAAAKIDIEDDGAGTAVNYDGMTRNELITLAEQRGLRAKKSSSRAELISLLRRAESLQINGSSAGTDAAGAASEPAGTLFPSSGALDGNFPVDLGQGAESVE